MDKKAFNDFIQRRYNPTLKHVKERAYYHQRMNEILQWATIILSFLTSVLIALEQFFSWVSIKATALVASLAVSALATILKTFDYHKKWLNYNRETIDLEAEFDMYTAHSGPYARAENREQLFVSKFIEMRLKSDDQTIDRPNKTLQQLRERLSLTPRSPEPQPRQNMPPDSQTTIDDKT